MKQCRLFSGVFSNVIYGLTLFLTLSQLHAAEINFSGFMSIHGGMTLDDGDNFEGYDDKLGFRPNSLFGLQVDVDLGNNLAATSQFIAKTAKNTDVKAQWAYLSYQINNDTRLNFGRISTPFFIHSQYINVGYAYTWLKPPSYMYDMQFAAAEGIDIVYSKELISNWESNTELFFGRNNDVVSYDSVTANQDISKLWILSSAVSNDWLLMRIIYAQATIDVRTELDVLAATVRPVNANAANEIVPANVPVKYYGAGFTIDFKNWLLSSEISNMNTDNSNGFFKDVYRGYISLGRKIGRFTPYYTYQLERWLMHTPPVVGEPTLDKLVADQFSASNDKKSAHIVGIRYLFHQAATFTLEYSTRKDELGTDDRLNARLVSFGIDLVF